MIIAKMSNLTQIQGAIVRLAYGKAFDIWSRK